MDVLARSARALPPAMIDDRPELAAKASFMPVQ